LQTITPGKTKIGWIGTGVMGGPMAGHLLAAGYPLTVYSRTKEKAKALIEKGAAWAGAPREVAEKSDVIFTIVSLPSDVRAVVLGERGVIQGIRSGGIFVDMTTSEPALAVEIDQAMKAKGVAGLDAPVSGGWIGAQNATLSIMVGGDEQVAAALMPLFQCMGKQIVYQGPSGSGQHTKMCNQILIATTMIGVVECLLYGHKAGLDLNKVIEAIGSGAAGCWAINNLGPRIVKRDFGAGFFVEHFLKDMRIALDEADRMGLALPGLALAKQLYLSVQAHGHGRSGTQALMVALERMSNTEFAGSKSPD